MKNKPYLLMIAIVILAIMVSACGNNTASNQSSSNTPETTTGNEPASTEEASGTITYESELGPVEIPANPQRIVALTNAPNVLSLDGTLVGVDEWTGANSLFTEKLEGVTVVSEGDLEGIAATEPDLIIAGTHMANIEEFSKIAPTVAFTWGKLDYLDQQVEIGKLLNKEAETIEWVNDFKQRAEKVGADIKAKYGDDVTVSVFSLDPKNVYVYGDNFARGTEILYQAMQLGMPENVKKDALGPGYFTLSQEVVADYSGDLIVVAKSEAAEIAFLDSDLWKSIPAVQNGNVVEIVAEDTSYSDPTTLEYLLEIFENGFLGQ